MACLVVSVRREGHVLLGNTAIKIPSSSELDNETCSYINLWEKITYTQHLNLDVDEIRTVRVYDVGKKGGLEINVDSLDLPVSFGTDMGLIGVEFQLANSTVLGAGAATSNFPVGEKNAFDIMMSQAITYSTPPKTDFESLQRKVTGFDRLRNDVIDWCVNLGAGWTQQGMTSGEKLVKTLTSALWYIQHQHAKFENQGAAIPPSFSSFQGYRDFTKLHMKAPSMNRETLAGHCNELASVVSLPSLSTDRNKAVLAEVEKLLDSLTKYRDHLKQDCQHHLERDADARDPNHSTHGFVEHETTIQYINGKPCVDDAYSKLDAHMEESAAYQFVNLDDFSPSDRVQRRRFIKNLNVSMPIMLLRMAYGGSLGTLNFVWRVNPKHTEAERILLNAASVEDVKKGLPKYCSRAVRRDFIHRYWKHVKAPKSILRHIFRELTGVSNAPETTEMAAVDERTAEFLLGADDTDIILDYRTMNGDTGGTKFTEFYEEVERYFEESLLAVHERRHGSEMYLPLAISVQDLRRQVSALLPEGTPIPSAETLRLQFHPLNEHVKTAERFTGRFGVKFRVQSRMARLHHPDSRYVATQYKYLKEFAVLNQAHTTMVCLDDKAVVPIGEPGVPISTGVRPHNRVLAPVEGPGPTAADHDFHISGLVPSVAFVLQIPGDARDSFFQGKAFVTVKDKVFEPSTPMRHAVELTTVLNSVDDNGDEPDREKSVLIVFTDGGPDHRVTYESVKLSLVAIFMELDLDMIIALRTAPHHSWVNPAERVMSVLNLALQHAALQREAMPENFEKKMKNKSGLASVRNTAELISGFREAYTTSQQKVIDLVCDRFERMRLKDEPLRTFKGASDDDIEHLLDVPKMVTGCTQLTSRSNCKDVRGCKELQEFIKKHDKSTQYCFQFKKCVNGDCAYCSANPVRMDEQDFSALHFLPDPVPDPEDKESYQSFTQLYGKDTTDRYRPSLTDQAGVTPEDREADKQNADVMKSGKVRGSITCTDCQKPRCVFSAKKLCCDQERRLLQLKEETWYVCGNTLPDTSLVTRQSLSCASPMEVTYYSAPCYLPQVCWHCGMEEGILGDFDEYIEDLLTKYSTVRPICGACRMAGKEAKTWGVKFFKKRKT